MRFLKNSILALAIFSLSSCLNIFENFTFKKDGSGHYSMKMDMSQMKDMMEMMKTMNAEGGENSGESANELSKIGDSFGELLAKIKSEPGISNAMVISDTTQFHFGYEFDFKNINSLNAALVKLSEDMGEGMKNPVPKDMFDFSKGKLKRKAGENMFDLMKKTMGGEADSPDMQQAKEFMQDATISTTYHFPDQKIKKQTSKFGQISADEHSVTVEAKPFSDGFDAKKFTSEIEIKLK
jgi:hypothetical protein